MAKRHKDALAIQDGACNPVAIVDSIQKAIEEVRAETPGWGAIRQDAAVRLMVHQLAYLCSTSSFESGYGVGSYPAVLDECERLAGQ